MRWLTLYARSRQIPIAFAAILVAIAGIGWLAQPDGSPRLAAMAAALGVAGAAAGFGGQDIRLDRTAAIAWPPRRAAHLIVVAAVVTAAVWATRIAPPEFVLRDGIGLAGLAALGATLFGATAAWALPVGWVALTMVVPPSQEPFDQVLTWMMQPQGTPAATATAIVCAATGGLAYTLLGCRR
ncbi:hypothetical protein AB5J62_36870 [Amycolatopsis sp. cg5]|uniref:hypothetical protein n=1 Tax=Amycolatopsis sp. cg5 TaxID=3238802 RepID=UPI00352443C4